MHFINHLRQLAAVLLLAATLPLQAQNIGDLQIDPQAVEALRDSAVEVGATLLQRAIADSRAQALRAGVQPIPPQMRAKLLGYYPAALLDRVRYRVGGGSDQSLQLNVIQYGDQAAITLEEVVVFARQADALNHDALWAHELWHVRQMQDWGLPEFARRYARDYRMVEGEADRAALQYQAWVRQRGTPTGSR
ncbi:MAG TPA: DUF4157 domain-containing protein [Solimonas sp.]|nr:DUF4157 domain-containing protein [Solimonas sp.]